MQHLEYPLYSGLVGRSCEGGRAIVITDDSVNSRPSTIPVERNEEVVVLVQSKRVTSHLSFLNVWTAVTLIAGTFVVAGIAY